MTRRQRRLRALVRVPAKEEPAPAAAPLPEVPAEIRKAPGPWGAYLVALDAAIRARGGL